MMSGLIFRRDDESKRMKTLRSVFACALFAAWNGLHANDGVDPTPKKTNLKRVLLFGYPNLGWWGNYDNLKSALDTLSFANGFQWDLNPVPDTISENPLSRSALDHYQAVILPPTSVRLVPDLQRKVIESWIQDGSGMVVMHESAFFTEGWAFLGDAVDFSFNGFTAGGGVRVPGNLSHDPEGIQEGSETKGIFNGIDAPEEFKDQFISMMESPRGRPETTILVTLQDSTIPGLPASRYMEDHPVVWTKRIGRGNVVTMALGLSSVDSSKRSPNYYDAFTQKDRYLSRLLYGTLRYIAGDFTGCMDSTDVNYNRDATHSDPEACGGLASIQSLPRRGLSISPVKMRILGNGRFAIRLSENGPYRIQLMDLRGQVRETREGVGPDSFEMAVTRHSGTWIMNTRVAGRDFFQKFALP